MFIYYNVNKKISRWCQFSVYLETHDVIEEQDTTLNDNNKLEGKERVAKLTVGLGIQRRGGGGMGSGAARYGGGEYLPEGKQPGAVIGAPWSPLLPIILSGDGAANVDSKGSHRSNHIKPWLGSRRTVRGSCPRAPHFLALTGRRRATLGNSDASKLEIPARKDRKDSAVADGGGWKKG
ncbi:hypothetical protein V1478_000387 [Vespula squamosa]|uniref:Uncharacterized protein n=1 Tax=Vespula squamosa TaxID=30214 RepID=A0ABD2C5C6_VESSQ